MSLGSDIATKSVRVSDDDAGEFSVLEGSLGGAIVEQVPRTGNGSSKIVSARLAHSPGEVRSTLHTTVG